MYNTENIKTEYKYTNYNYTTNIDLQLGTVSFHKFHLCPRCTQHPNHSNPDTLSDQAYKLTQSLTWLTQSPATVLPYYSVHINNFWCKITSFKIIPSRAECDIHTQHRHSKSKNYTLRRDKTNHSWTVTKTSCIRTKRCLHNSSRQTSNQ